MEFVTTVKGRATTSGIVRGAYSRFMQRVERLEKRAGLVDT